MTTARRYTISGRVQGVGFRWFVQREAQLQGIAGWVRNNIDGAVEVFATGSEQQLASFSAKLKQGPRAARVERVEESAAEPENGKNFRIEGAW